MIAAWLIVRRRGAAGRLPPDRRNWPGPGRHGSSPPLVMRLAPGRRCNCRGIPALTGVGVVAAFDGRTG